MEPVASDVTRAVACPASSSFKTRHHEHCLLSPIPSSSFPHLFPLLCGVDVSYETPPFSTVLCVLP